MKGCLSPSHWVCEQLFSHQYYSKPNFILNTTVSHKPKDWYPLYTPCLTGTKTGRCFDGFGQDSIGIFPHYHSSVMKWVCESKGQSHTRMSIQFNQRYLRTKFGKNLGLCSFNTTYQNKRNKGQFCQPRINLIAFIAGQWEIKVVQVCLVSVNSNSRMYTYIYLNSIHTLYVHPFLEKSHEHK